MKAAVIGVGNEYRRDDGIGPAVISALIGDGLTGDGLTGDGLTGDGLTGDGLTDVALVVADGEPTQLLDAWSGVELAIVVDAVLCEPSTPGRIHRTTISADLSAGRSSSTHGLGIPDAIALAEVLDRAPRHLVVLAVEAADLGFGVGLTPLVAAALPEVTRAVLAELEAARPDPARPVARVGAPEHR